MRFATVAFGTLLMVGCASGGDDPDERTEAAETSTSITVAPAQTDGAPRSAEAGDADSDAAFDIDIDEGATDAGATPPVDAELLATALRSLADTFPDAVATLSADPTTAPTVEGACRAAVEGVAGGATADAAADAVAGTVADDARATDVQAVLLLAVARYFILDGCGADVDVLVPALNRLANERL